MLEDSLNNDVFTSRIVKESEVYQIIRSDHVKKKNSKQSAVIFLKNVIPYSCKV